jgi:Domain of Unknown Function (DUF1080)
MRGLLAWAMFSIPFLGFAQKTIPLTDMSAWQPMAEKNWSIVGDVMTAVDKENTTSTAAGTGVLLNMPNATNRANLVSKTEYGDVDVSFDFMMVKKSNSGFYLMGRYEVQLLDSWGVKNPKYSDCGGIYKRRRYLADSTEVLWEGHAPRTNACLAPGLWQHIDISFQAPKFDAAGKKVANAKFLKVVMNGILLHENVELTGPTGGPISEDEATTGPFMIQGDHGAVAFKNMVTKNFDGKPLEINALQYKVFYGKFKDTTEFQNKAPNTEGPLDKLNWTVSKEANDYALMYKGALKAPTAGKYKLVFQIGGKSIIKVNGATVLPDGFTHPNSRRTIEVQLNEGDNPLDITIYKTDGWVPGCLGLMVESANLRPIAMHNFASTLGAAPADPIYLDAKEPQVFRSFMDFSKGKYKKRIVKAVSVGSPEQVHYTYNMENGALVQLWKGDFLNTSPMWDNRGDGSSRPRGATLLLNDMPPLTSTENKAIDTLSPTAQYRPMGYDVDDNNMPTFRYQIYGAEVEDMIRVTDNKYLTRSISVKNATGDMLCRLAVGKDVTKVTEEIYVVDGKGYFIKLPSGAKPTIEKTGDNTTLFVSIKDKIQYSILW